VAYRSWILGIQCTGPASTAERYTGGIAATDVRHHPEPGELTASGMA
jgi:hypothetical protein